MDRVELVEVGPRDGLQNEDRALPVSVRVDLVRRLLDLGLRRLEVASFVRGDKVPQMSDAEAVLAALEDAPQRAESTYVGLVLNRRGAVRAAETPCDEINMVVPVTDEFATRNQGATTAALVEQAAGAVEVARAAGQRVSVTLAVAFGCPFSGPVTPEQVAPVVEQVLDLGVDELAFADTVGVGAPTQVGALAALVADRPPERLRFHFHNTRNTGYANAYAATALDLPASTALALDASIGGFGGCPFAPAATGNIATEDLAYLLRSAGVATTGPESLDVAAAAELSLWLAAQLDSPVTAQLGRAGDFGSGA